MDININENNDMRAYRLFVLMRGDFNPETFGYTNQLSFDEKKKYIQEAIEDNIISKPENGFSDEFFDEVYKKFGNYFVRENSYRYEQLSERNRNLHKKTTEISEYLKTFSVQEGDINSGLLRILEASRNEKTGTCNGARSLLKTIGDDVILDFVNNPKISKNKQMGRKLFDYISEMSPESMIKVIMGSKFVTDYKDRLDEIREKVNQNSGGSSQISFEQFSDKFGVSGVNIRVYERDNRPVIDEDGFSFNRVSNFIIPNNIISDFRKEISNIIIRNIEDFEVPMNQKKISSASGFRLQNVSIHLKKKGSEWSGEYTTYYDILTPDDMESFNSSRRIDKLEDILNLSVDFKPNEMTGLDQCATKMSTKSVRALLENEDVITCLKNLSDENDLDNPMFLRSLAKVASVIQEINNNGDYIGLSGDEAPEEIAEKMSDQIMKAREILFDEMKN